MSASMTYDELMAAVYALPALHPAGLARDVVIALAVIIAVNTVIVALRVYVRTIMNRGTFGADDILAVGGYVCYLVATVYAIKGCFYGLGTRDVDLPSELYLVRGAQLLLWWQIPYVLSIPLIKSSIAVQIMRLTPAKRFRIPLWLVVVGSTFNALAGLVAALIHCKPISASWSGMGTCGSNVPLLYLSYLFTAIAILADFTCALVPFFLIRGLNMNPRKKWSLVAVLSVGVCAGIFTIVRVPFFTHYLIATDALYYQGYIILWSMLEEGIGIFAASLPSMRKFFRNFYGSTHESRSTGQPGLGGVDAGGRAGDTPLNNLYPSLNNLYPAAKRGNFTATVVSSHNHDGIGSPGKWEALDGEDASSRRRIITQREVYLETTDDDSQ